MIEASQARARALDLLASCEGRGEFQFVPGLFVDTARDLAEWILAAIGTDDQGAGAYPVIRVEIVKAATFYGEVINDFAAELVGRLPPATTLCIVGALLRALDEVPP